MDKFMITSYGMLILLNIFFGVASVFIIHNQDGASQCGKGASLGTIIPLEMTMLVLSLLGLCAEIWNKERLRVLNRCLLGIMSATVVGLLIFRFSVVEYGMPELLGYSPWLQEKLVTESKWEGIKQCFIKERICQNLPTNLTMAAGNITDLARQWWPIQTACCMPPNCSGIPHASSGHDCSAWSPDIQQLCFDCFDCKGAYLYSQDVAFSKTLAFSFIQIFLLLGLGFFPPAESGEETINEAPETIPTWPIKLFIHSSNVFALAFSIWTIYHTVTIREESESIRCGDITLEVCLFLEFLTLIVALLGILNAAVEVKHLGTVHTSALRILIGLLVVLLIYRSKVTNDDYELNNGPQLLRYTASLQKLLVSQHKWDSIKNCMVQRQLCQKLPRYVHEARNVTRAVSLYPIEMSCCRAPSQCGYDNNTYQNGNLQSSINDRDCSIWSNNINYLCYDCDQCKAGYLYLQELTFSDTLIYLLLCALFQGFIAIMVWIGKFEDKKRK